jgi:hypothetical protein
MNITNFFKDVDRIGRVLLRPLALQSFMDLGLFEDPPPSRLYQVLSSTMPLL